MPIAGVVADANVLLSAIVGKAALRVFTEYNVAVHVARFNVDEVEEYLPHMAEKYDLPAELVGMQLRLLPLRIHPVRDYADLLAQANAELRNRDPDDAHVLALARVLGLPIWSNDRDLSAVGVECYTTARLIRLLDSPR